jgi:hypothetical protein
MALGKETAEKNGDLSSPTPLILNESHDTISMASCLAKYGPAWLLSRYSRYPVNAQSDGSNAVDIGIGFGLELVTKNVRVK